MARVAARGSLCCHHPRRAGPGHNRRHGGSTNVGGNLRGDAGDDVRHVGCVPPTRAIRDCPTPDAACRPLDDLLADRRHLRPDHHGRDAVTLGNPDSRDHRLARRHRHPPQDVGLRASEVAGVGLVPADGVDRRDHDAGTPRRVDCISAGVRGGGWCGLQPRHPGAFPASARPVANDVRLSRGLAHVRDRRGGTALRRCDEHPA